MLARTYMRAMMTQVLNVLVSKEKKKLLDVSPLLKMHTSSRASERTWHLETPIEETLSKERQQLPEPFILNQHLKTPIEETL